jgi:hypothetical protein
MSKGSISKKEKSDTLKRHKENEEEEDMNRTGFCRYGNGLSVAIINNSR